MKKALLVLLAGLAAGAASGQEAVLDRYVREGLENNLALSQIIDLKDLNSDKVIFGSTVTIEDINSGKSIQYQLVGPFESDINQNMISVTSPIGKALIGKSMGDAVSVKTPGGIREFEVVKISFRNES